LTVIVIHCKIDRQVHIKKEEFLMRDLRASVFSVFIVFAVSGFAVNGKTLYKKCVACHGTDGTKSALNNCNCIGTVAKE